MFIPFANDYHNGLYIELKKSKDVIFKKNGEYRKDKHLVEQMKMHRRLENLGYRVDFCWSLEQFIEILKDHMGIEYNDLRGYCEAGKNK